MVGSSLTPAAAREAGLPRGRDLYRLGAGGEAAQRQYLAAAEALLAFYNGTAWMILTVFIALSGLISSLLMFPSQLYSRTTAYLGLFSTVPAFFFFLPVVGPQLLYLVTVVGVAWYLLIARTLYRLGRGTVRES